MPTRWVNGLFTPGSPLGGHGEDQAGGKVFQAAWGCRWILRGLLNMTSAAILTCLFWLELRGDS